MKSEKSFFQKFLNIISWLFLGCFVVTLILTAVSNLNVSGGYKSLIVQSGSMEPTIMTGDVVIVAKSQNYNQNDVVTFTDTENQITTHRIAEIISDGKEKQYSTKGDANRAQDIDSIMENQIIGKVILIIPKLGYFLAFVRSPLGLIIFIGFPALLIVADEVAKIFNAISQKKSNL